MATVGAPPAHGAACEYPNLTAQACVLPPAIAAMSAAQGTVCVTQRVARDVRDWVLLRERLGLQERTALWGLLCGRTTGREWLAPRLGCVSTSSYSTNAMTCWTGFAVTPGDVAEGGRSTMGTS